jgi:DNA repair exonuclease SbcCD ATPase subunit
MKADVANVLTQLILTDSRENELVIKRERERESRIANLKAEIQQLEQITNRTPQQEQELQSKREQLKELERKNNSIQPSKTNYLPWIIGGGIVLVLVIGIIAYFWGKSKEK